MAKTVDARPSDVTFIPINLASLRVDSVTSFDVYFQPSPTQPFVLYSEKNLQFTEATRQRLVDSGVEQVYIHPSELGAYSRYIEANLASILTDAAIPAQEKSDILYTSASGVSESVFANPQSHETLHRSKEVVKHSVNFMLANGHVFMGLLRVLSSVYRVYTHCVNVVTYVVALAQRAGYADAATLRELAIAALLHDIGKSKIDPAILHSAASLTPRQWEEVQQHPRIGYDLLVSTGAVGEIALDIVLHHHEKIHGGGYPDNLKGNQVSPFVRMVRIADMFDALTTDRPFQRARSSFAALSVMRAQIGSDLDPDLFRTFVALMGGPGS